MNAAITQKMAVGVAPVDTETGIEPTIRDNQSWASFAQAQNLSGGELLTVKMKAEAFNSERIEATLDKLEGKLRGYLTANLGNPDFTPLLINVRGSNDQIFSLKNQKGDDGLDAFQKTNERIQAVLADFPDRDGMVRLKKTYVSVARSEADADAFVEFAKEEVARRTAAGLPLPGLVFSGDTPANRSPLLERARQGLATLGSSIKSWAASLLQNTSDPSDGVSKAGERAAPSVSPSDLLNAASLWQPQKDLVALRPVLVAPIERAGGDIQSLVEELREHIHGCRAYYIAERPDEIVQGLEEADKRTVIADHATARKLRSALDSISTYYGGEARDLDLDRNVTIIEVPIEELRQRLARPRQG